MPYIRKRVIVAATEEDLAKLLRSPNVLVDDFSPETRAQVSDIGKLQKLLSAF